MSDNKSTKQINEFKNPLSDVFDELGKWSKDAKEKKKINYSAMNPVDKFKFFVRCDSWSLKEEAIPLIMGVSPNYMRDIDGFNWSLYHQLYKLSVKCVGDSLDVIDMSIPQKSWEVNSQIFLQWALNKKTGINKEFLEVYKSINPEILLEEKVVINTLPEYSTPLMDIMYKVIHEYWEGKRLGSVKNRKDLVPLLMKKYGISSGEAKAIDTITRDPARRGK